VPLDKCLFPPGSFYFSSRDDKEKQTEKQSKMLMNSKFNFMNAVFISLDMMRGPTDQPTDKGIKVHSLPLATLNFCLDSFSPVVTLCLHVCVCVWRDVICVLYMSIATTSNMITTSINVRGHPAVGHHSGIIKSYPPPLPPKISVVCRLLARLLSFWVIMICCHIVGIGKRGETDSKSMKS
jgi:hypothetical protein